ncbi:unnamed protein product [Heligmosomoides polygyrus]|uniref:USP domain-containing protein n=1 Tax=Heligmosomoides polygyrus TaxID=6339 RepID=A0A183GFT2_HELPZ|nr:unnamed protein product [Heligmosomoides polygyrus]
MVCIELECRSIGVYKIYVQRGEKSVEVPCAHEWKTLEQVGMVALRDGICETEDVDISIRCPRLSVSSVKCDSGKCISEKHLPGVIVHETSGVFPMLYELLGIADGEIQKACQRILALIPVDPTVLSALAIKESPSKSVHENLDENAVINKHLTPSDPFRLLYTLEVLSGLLVPTSATKGTVAISNRLSRAILKSDVYNHLLKLLTIPHTIAPIAASERTRIFELLTLIFGVLLHGQSVLSNAITHDGQCLADLQSFKRSERRKDPLYEDLSTLAIDSTSAISSFNCDEFSTLLTMLRDCAWRAAAGWLLHSLRLPVHNSYFGILPRRVQIARISIMLGSEAPSGATSPSEVFLDLPAFNVPDAPSASESIRRSGAEALDDRSEALTNDILMLMTRCLIGRLNSSRVDRDEKKGLLKLCTTDVWRDFWKDVLVYTVTDRLRRHARDALVNIARSLSVESDICTLLFMLLETMEAVPFCKDSSVKIDRLAHRQLDNALDLHLCLASILDLGRIHSEDNRGFWRIVERDPVQIAWEIFDFMTSMGLDANYSDIDADFVYSKLCIGDKFMTSVLGCCVFAQVLSSSSSKVWEAKNSLFALEILADLSESVPRNAARLIDWLYNYFGELRELEWEFRPMLESRVLDHVGLQNAGGTCYMNSVLQQLFAIPGLAAHLFSIEMPKGENSENRFRLLLRGDEEKTVSSYSQLLAAVQSVFARLAMTRCRLYVPREIWDTFRFYGADRLDTRQQHDAVDFFTELIDRVDSALEAQKMPLLFRPRLCGKFTYEYICYGCFHRHIGAEEEFLAVNLELHGPSLEECLEHYVNGELLECDNAYYCCKCEEKRNTLRRGSFCKLPSTLTIQLKRFSYDINGRVDKKNDFCSFPMVLDMAPYCSQARAVCDQELKSLFDDARLSMNLGAISSDGVNFLKIVTEIGTLASLPCQLRRYRFLQSLEKLPEMRHTSTYEKWVELNDAEVRLFPATPEAMECEWFGGSFTASPSTTFSPRLDLPKERLRSYSAYVLIYEKKDARVNAVSEKPPRLPLQLLNCVDNENVSFLKDRDLFSSSYGYAVSKTVSNFVTYLEGAEDLKNEEHVKMAVAIFDMLFDYCYKALWRLSYEAREGRVFDMSVNGIRGLLRLSSAVRQKFFELLTNYNYKVFYTMMSCPEDVCGAWWRVVGDALTCWFDDHDASRVPQTSVKLPAGIISRMIGQIKMAGQSNECCVNCVLRCLNGFVCNSSSGSFLLVADGALQAVSDLIATDCITLCEEVVLSATHFISIVLVCWCKACAARWVHFPSNVNRLLANRFCNVETSIVVHKSDRDVDRVLLLDPGSQTIQLLTTQVT